MNKRGDVTFQDIFVLFAVYILTLSLVSSVAGPNLLDNQSVTIPNVEDQEVLGGTNESVVVSNSSAIQVEENDSGGGENKSLEKMIEINKTIELGNETIILENETETVNQTNETKILSNDSLIKENSSVGNETNSSFEEVKEEIFEEEIVPEILNDSYLLEEELIQGEAVVGEGVRWTKKVITTNPDYQIEFPEGATSFGEVMKEEIGGEFYFEANYTTAPALMEVENLTDAQKVLIYSEDHYENVSANITFNGDLKVEESNRLKVYWEEGDRYLEFNATDNDNDTYIDEVEWEVPHLSNQTFLIYVEISKAEYLSINRTFKQDIFEEVSSLDNFWSPEIKEGEYVRVTFEVPLDDTRDITIYPRVLSGSPVVEVYEKDEDTKIAEFSVLNNESYNKVYLTNLVGRQDTFDLKIVNGSVEFDHIIDPDLDWEDWQSYVDYDTSFTGNWTNVGGDNCDWQTDSSGTASSGTGPSFDHTYGNSTGQYAYLETSTSPPAGSSTTCGTTGNEAYLESNNMDADNYNITLNFWYNLNGPTIGALHVDVYNGTWYNDIWSLSGNQGDVWTNVDLNLGDYYGSSLKIRFRGTRGSNWDGDLAIDDINISATYRNLPPTDPTSITCNGGTCGIVADQSVELNCSGSTDPDSDLITYFLTSPKSGDFNDQTIVSESMSVQSVGNVSYFYDGGEGWTLDTNCGNDPWDVCDIGDGFVQSNDNEVGPPTGPQNGSRFIMAWDHDAAVNFLEKNENLSQCNEAYVQFGVNLGNSLEAGEGVYVYFDDGTGQTLVYDSESAGEQDETWRNKSFAVSNYVDLTGDFTLVFNGQPTFTYDNNEYIALDDVKIICEEFGAGPNLSEENSSLVTHIDLDDNYELVNTLQIKVEVDSYNPEASYSQSTTFPDLFLNVYNGTDWLSQGEFDLSSNYIFGTEDGTDTNFTISVTDPSIISSWDTLENQDIQIKGVDMDFVDSNTFDEIKYKSIWVSINGEKFDEIGNHTEGGSYVWNTSGVSDTAAADLECKAVDLGGTGQYSGGYGLIDNLAIDHTNPVVDFGAGSILDGDTIYISSIYTNVSLVEANFQNITFSLYNSTSVVNETTFTGSTRDITWVGLGSGIYFYNVTTYDNVSRSNSTVTRNVTIDVTDPVIGYGGGVENDGASVSQDFVYVNTTIVEDNFENVTFYLYNSTGLETEVTYTALTLEHSFTSLSDGFYEYNVTVYDKGNRSDSTATRNITLDQGAPSGTLTSPPAGLHTNNPTNSFNVSASDTSGLKQAILYIFNETGSLIHTNSTLIAGLAATVGLVYTFVADGIYTWYYRIVDLADNFYETPNRTIIFDTTSASISLESVLNNSGDVDGNLNLQFNVTDTLSEIVNCSLILNGVDYNTTYSVTKNSIEGFQTDGLGIGPYNWSIQCFDEANNSGVSELRYFDVLYATSFGGTTTDFSTVDISNISNLVLERTLYGKIEFNEDVNLSGGVNLNSLVTISPEFVEVDSVTESRLNKSATITLYNLNYEFLPIIFKDGQVCSDCDLNYYSGGNLSFNATSFSNYSLSENSKLSIWDETDPEEGSQVRYADDQIIFYSNYTNTTSYESVNGTGVYCNITFDDGEAEMAFNATSLLYEYNRSFTIYGTYDYDVECNGSAQGYEALVVSDTVEVSTPQITDNDRYGYKVQGSQEIINSATQYININPVNDTSRAFILPTHYYSTGQRNVTPQTGTGAQTDHDWADYTTRLYNTSTIEIKREATDDNILVDWQLIEATNKEFTVYRGEQDVTNSGADFYLPIGGTVNATNTMVWVTGYRSTGVGRDWYDRHLIRGYQYNSTHARFQRQDGTISNLTLSWVAVEWNMSKIDSFQTGNATVIGGTHSQASPLQVTLNTTVDLTDSIMFFQAGAANSGLDQVATAGSLTGASTLEFYTGNNGLGTADDTTSRMVRWYVIDFGANSGHRERGTIDYSADTTWYDVNQDLSQEVDLNRTVNFISLTHDGAGDAQPRPFPNSFFKDNNTLNIYRTRSGQESFIEWQVLELPYGENLDAPQFYDFSVNKSYAANGEVVRINMTVNDTTDNINYVNALISGTAYDFNQNGQEWYYDYQCTTPGVVNLTWVIARDDGDPNRWNQTNITNTYFVCDPENPLIDFNNTFADGVYTANNYLYVQTSLDEDNFKNITYYLYNSSGLVNSTTFTSFGNNITFNNLVTDTYYYNVTAVDLAEQKNSTSTRSVHIDIDNPLIEFVLATEDNDSIIEGEEVYVNVSVIEDNEANITFTLYDDTMSIERQNFFATAQRDITWNNLNDGIYYYEVLVKDLVNRENTTELRKITIDNSIPVINYGIGTETNTTNVSRNWVYVNVSVSVTNEENITFTLRNSTGIVNQTTYTTAVRTINWTNLPDEDYYYNVTVFDQLSRSDSTEDRMIRLDTTYPLIDYTTGAEQDWANLSRNFVYVNVSLTETYLENLTFTIYNSTGIYNQTTYTDSTREINWTNVPDGKYYYLASACDFSNNCNFTNYRNVTVDTGSVNSVLFSPSDGIYVNSVIQDLMGLFSDNLGLDYATLKVWNVTPTLINETNYSLSGTLDSVTTEFNFSTDGNYTWTYEVFDFSSNSYEPTPYSIIVDTANPTIEYAAGTEASGQNFDRDWIYINVTADDLNFKNVTFVLWGPDNREITFTNSTREINWTGLSDGIHRYNVTVYDKAGNSNTTSTRLMGLDTTGPVVNIYEPETKIYSYNVSLPLNYTAVDALIGLDECWWNLDGGVNNSIACGTNATFNTTEGEHTMYVYANDSFGNMGSDSVIFSVSITGPAVTLLAPADASFYDSAGTYTFNYSAFDPDLVDSCSLYGDWNGGWHLNQTDYGWTLNGPLEFSDDFDGGTLDSNWTTYGSNGFSRIDARTDISRSGSYSVVADSNLDNNYALNELITAKDFTNATNIVLDFYWTDFGDETNAASDHTGNQNSDGAFFTCDGNQWYVISDFQPASATDQTWNNVNVNISADPNFCSQVNSSFAIKFTQYDNFGWGTDGIAWDDINITYAGDYPKAEGNFSVYLGNEGVYNWNVQCNDTLGYDTFAINNWTIVLDTTTPQIDWGTGVAANEANLSQNWIFANVTVSEANEKNITFSLYNSSGVVNETTFLTPVRTINWTNLGEGKYSYNVTVIDGAGRTNFTTTRNITLDYTSPGSTGTSPSNNTYSSSTTQTFEVNATDNQGLKQAILYIFNETGSLIHTNSTLITGLAASAGLVYTFLADGIYTWYYRIIDIADNFYEIENQTIIIDTLYPQIDYSTGVEVDFANVSHDWIYVNVTIDEINFANVTFDLFGPDPATNTYSDSTRSVNWTGLTDGTYGYNVTTVDLANQENYTTTRTITIETVAPLVTINSPSPIAYSTTTIEFNVTINEEGYCNFTLDSGSTFYEMDTTDNLTFNYTNSSMGQGQFTAEYYCWDLFGNLNNTESVTFDIDTQAPQISFVAPTEDNNTFFSRNFITANVSVYEPYEKNITFELVGPDSFKNTYTNARRLINWTFLQEGVFEYNVSTYDDSNNFNTTETRKITLDRTSPVVDFGSLTPIDYANISKDWLQIEANVTELYPESVTYTLYNLANISINQTTKGMADVNSNTTINWTGLADGTYYYDISVQDRAGNTQTTPQREIRVDTTLPIVNFAFGTEADGAEFERDWIYASSTASELYPKNSTYYLYNDSGIINVGNYSTIVSSINWSGLASNNVSYYYNVSVWDYSGNVGSSETRNISLIDVTAPVLTLHSPLNTTYTYNESILLNYSVIESNLDTCWYNIDGGSNITVPGCIEEYFDVSDEAVHTVYLFVNDSMGYTDSANVTFFVNSSLIITNDYRIKTGSTSVDGTSDVSVDSFDPSKSFIIHTSRSGDPGPDSLQVTSTFLNSQNIQFENYASGGGASVEYTVVTGPDIAVQRSEVIYGITIGTTGAFINAVNLSSSFLVVENRLNSGSGADNAEGFWTGRFVNDSYVEFQRGATGTAGVISYQVVDWEGVVVQNGNHTISAAGTNSGDTTINSVDLNKSFIITSERLTGGDLSIGDMFARTFFVNDTTIQSERWLTDGTNDLEYFIVTSDRFIAQSADYTHLLQSSAQYGSLNDPLVNFSRAFDIHSHENDGGGTTYSNGFVTQRIYNSTDMVLQKGTASNNGETTWFAVEIKDLISPNVNLTYPADNYSFSTSLVDDFRFKVFDYQQIENCSLWGNWSGGWHLNQTITSVSQGVNNFSAVDVTNGGNYIWNVVCIDQYGNEGWEDYNFTFNIDVTPPQISYESPTTGNNSILSQDWIFINVSVIDPHLDGVILEFQGLNESFDNSAGDYYWENKTGLLGGDYEFKVYAYDLGGNYNSTTKRFVSLDFTPPAWSNSNQSLEGSYSELIHLEETMTLYSTWTDFYGLNNSWLATNESGAWENKTLNYSSPAKITGTTNQSYFYWSNSSMGVGDEVYWRIYGEDIAGNVNSTLENKFRVWGYMQVESALSKQGVKEGENVTMLCKVSDNYTSDVLSDQTVSFFVNDTYLGNDVTDMAGFASLTFNLTSPDTYQVRCNVSENSTIYYHTSGLENPSNQTLVVGDGYFSYDFRSTLNKTAYEGDTNMTSTEINESYSTLAFDEGIFQEYTSSPGSYANTRFEFKINSAEQEITKMNVLWNGFGQVGSGTNGYIIYIYNFTSGNWVQKSSSTSGAENTVSFDQLDGFGDLVNATGYVYVLARSYSPAPTGGAVQDRWASIDTDFVKLDVYTDIYPPIVILESPVDYYNSSTAVDFVCNVSDDYSVEEVWLYGDWNGAWHQNQTNTSEINNVNYTFNQDLEEGAFNWSCRACDFALNCDYASLNRTVTIDKTAPNVTLTYPVDTQNITGYTVSEFNFTVNDTNEVLDCNLFGNWSLGWHENQTINNPVKETELNFSSATTNGDGFYSWNVNCTDYSGNSAFSIANFSFATFLPPYEPVLVNITQTSNDGQGNVTINWNDSNHSLRYRIYASDNLTNLSFVYETAGSNYTDSNFAGERRRFYRVEAVNPVGTNLSAERFGAHLYTLEHDGVSSKNWIGFPTNFSLQNANDSYHEINGAVSFTTMNFTSQKRVTCNDFSCPTSFSCTDTACNFELEAGKGYEVEINTTGASEVNWSGVGFVQNPITINFGHNDPALLKNREWIALSPETNLTNARELYSSLGNVDAVTNWNRSHQTSEGTIELFPGVYVGKNFDLEMERGYEVSTTSAGVWTQE